MSLLGILELLARRRRRPGASGIWTAVAFAAFLLRQYQRRSARDSISLREELRPDGHTPLYDAIDATTSELVRMDPDGASRRHLTALVVLTDGENLPGGGPGAELSASDLVRSARAEAAADAKARSEAEAKNATRPTTTTTNDADPRHDDSTSPESDDP